MAVCNFAVDVHMCARDGNAGRPRFMALYVVLLTNPKYAALELGRRVAVLKDVIIGRGAAFPHELSWSGVPGDMFGDHNWGQWVASRSLSGILKRLPPEVFADVVFCLLSACGMSIAKVGDARDEAIGSGLAYITVFTNDTCVATFVEVCSLCAAGVGCVGQGLVVRAAGSFLVPGFCCGAALLLCSCSPFCWKRLCWLLGSPTPFASPCSTTAVCSCLRLAGAAVRSATFMTRPLSLCFPGWALLAWAPSGP
jgi:hypothetical protein